jgi:hypothetical protein
MMADSTDLQSNTIGRDVQLTLAGIRQSLDALTAAVKAQTAAYQLAQTISTTAGSASGKFGNLSIGGIPYKVTLLNP